MPKSRKIPRAAYIPYYKEDNEIYIMIMIPSDPNYGGSYPQLAKGHIEDNESPKEAAIREAEEEVGLKRKNIVKTHYLGTFLGYTEVFYGEVHSPTDFGETTSETGDSYWIEVNDFFNSGRDIHKPIVHEFLKAIS